MSSIEPSHAFTVHIRVVLPPKAAPRVLQPKLSMAEDAKLINRRFRKTWGNTTPEQAGNDANMIRHQESVARREAIAENIIALLQSGGKRSSELREATGESENQVRSALATLSREGRAIPKRGAKGVIMWVLA